MSRCPCPPDSVPDWTHGDLSISTITGSSRARRLPNRPRAVNTAKSKLIVNRLAEFTTLTVLSKPGQAHAPGRSGGEARRW